jgi:alpha-N-arabinofuranosidase
LLEEIYNLEDALVVGGLLNTLIRRSDRVRLACLAQLVNVIAPIMTNENGLFRQTIYYPYAWALEHARGKALELAVTSPAYQVPVAGRPAARSHESMPVPYLDVAGTIDVENKTASLFVLNRDLEKARDLELVWHETTPTRVNTCQVLTGSDLKAENGFDAPDRVVPKPLDPPTPGSKMALEVPARSYVLLNLGLA